MQRNTDQTLMNTSEMIYLSARSIVRYNLDTILCYQTMKININEIFDKNNKNTDGFRWIMEENPYNPEYDILNNTLSGEKYQTIQEDFGVI